MTKHINLFHQGVTLDPGHAYDHHSDYLHQIQLELAFDPSQFRRLARTTAVNKLRRHPQGQRLARLAWDLALLARHVPAIGTSLADLKRDDRPVVLRLSKALLNDPSISPGDWRVVTAAAGLTAMAAPGHYIRADHEGRQGAAAIVLADSPWLTGESRVPAPPALPPRKRANSIRARINQRIDARRAQRRVA